MEIDWRVSMTYPSPRMPVYARNVVATSQPLATQAGVDAMRNGGNAMDAALAAAICLTVVEPTSNGIGSDAFALIWGSPTSDVILNPVEGDVRHSLHGFNGSGRSPRNWSMSKFASMERVPLRGWESVTVPGCVDTWVQCSKRFGRLPFAELFTQAIHYAEHGYQVSPITAQAWSHAPHTFEGFEEFYKTFLPSGHPPTVGQTVYLPHHAKTLRMIAESNGEAFYRGSLADRIIDDARAHGSDFSMEDFSSHKGEWVEPISTKFLDFDVHEIPPNGQGLAALVALAVLRHTPLLNFELDSADFYHFQIEAMKCGFAEVFAHVCDPSFKMEGRAPSPPNTILDEDNIRRYAALIKPDGASVPHPMLEAAPSTVYLCAADDNDMMVSFIQSNFHGFGSGIVVPNTGIAMQNRAYGFTLEKGHPNEAGPGKRPFHTIIPGFATKNGAPLMAFGVMGGHMQAQGHVQMVVRILGYGQDPQSACDAPRWQVTPEGEVWLEEGFSERVGSELANRGHKVRTSVPFTQFGGGQFALKTEHGYCAASDNRKDGCAIGF